MGSAAPASGGEQPPSKPEATEDPGDRALKLQRGDPFEKGITENQMARRLETRKLLARVYLGSTCGEALYKVERFRRFLPGRGADNRGLIQFWGPRAVRKFEAGEKPPEWRVESPRRLRTVAVGEISRVYR